MKSPSKEFTPVGELVGDRYLVIAKIGKGTFANVYSARDMRTGGLVAIKYQQAEVGGGMGLYAREAEIFKRVASSDRVPRLHCHALLLPTFSPAPYSSREVLIMDMCGGEDMAHLRNRSRESWKQTGQGAGHSKIPLPVAAYLCSEMVSCLRALHVAGIVHRDVKPGNFVRESADSTRFRVLDFGLARKWIDDKGRVVPARKDVGFRGTSNYASVVALRGQEQGPRDDLYSVLYVFVDMVCNSMPWSGVERSKSWHGLTGGLVGKKEDYSGDPGKKDDKLTEWMLKEVPSLPHACLECVSAVSGYLASLKYEDMPDHGRLVSLFTALYAPKSSHIEPASASGSVNSAESAATETGSVPASAAVIVSEPAYGENGFRWAGGSNHARDADTAPVQPTLLHRARAALGHCALVRPTAPTSSSVHLGAETVPLIAQGRAWRLVATEFLAVIKVLRDKLVRACLVVRLVECGNFQDIDTGDDEAAWDEFQAIMETTESFVAEFAADVNLCKTSSRSAYFKSLGLGDSELLPRLRIKTRDQRQHAGDATTPRPRSVSAGDSPLPSTSPNAQLSQSKKARRMTHSEASTHSHHSTAFATSQGPGEASAASVMSFVSSQQSHATGTAAAAVTPRGDGASPGLGPSSTS
jgi:tau tubulin kinase